MSEFALQFVAGAGPSSFAIERFGIGVGGLSHVDLVLPDGRLMGARSDVITPPGSPIAIPAGFRIRPPDYERWARRVKMTLQCSAEQKDRALKFAMSQEGKPYDDWDILGFIFGHHWHTQGHWICSAVASATLIASGLISEMYFPVEEITPNTLASVVSSHGAICT